MMSDTRRQQELAAKRSSSLKLSKPLIIESPHINLKDKVSQMNKTLYKTKVNVDKIEKLEKDALRGEGAEIPEAKIAAKVKIPVDYMTLVLKSEHKATLEGTQILKLPKLPFGKHKSYNDDPMFKDKHFLEDRSTVSQPEKMKELEEITRKYRLYEKKFKAHKKSRLQSAENMFSDMAFFDVYEMGPGRLICSKDQQVIQSYDKDKEKYKDLSLDAIFAGDDQSRNESLDNKYFGRKPLRYSEQKELISRLLPTKEAKDTNLSQFYSTKYSSLFENEEPRNKKTDVRRSSVS